VRRHWGNPLAVADVRQPLLSFVTVGEMTKWAKLRHRGQRNIAMLDDWLSPQAGCPWQQIHRRDLGNLSATANQRDVPAACYLA
jgi:hypothetical protein